MWIKVNAIGDAHFSKGHTLEGARGEIWVSLSAATALLGHLHGTIIVFPCGGSILVDQEIDAITSKIKEGR